MSGLDEQEKIWFWKKIKRRKIRSGYVLLIICCILLGTLFSSILIKNNSLENPQPVYKTYLNSEYDGFEKIEFAFSTSITDTFKNTKVLLHDNVEGRILLSRSYIPKGFYYKYSVIYNNGTILESEKEFLPYGTNRTLMNMTGILLYITQIEYDYVEDPSIVKEKFSFIMGCWVGMLLSVLFCIWSILEFITDIDKYGWKY
jgi:hypothetical protein